MNDLTREEMIWLVKDINISIRDYDVAACAYAIRDKLLIEITKPDPMTDVLVEIRERLSKLEKIVSECIK